MVGDHRIVLHVKTAVEVIDRNDKCPALVSGSGVVAFSALEPTAVISKNSFFLLSLPVSLELLEYRTEGVV